MFISLNVDQLLRLLGHDRADVSRVEQVGARSPQESPLLLVFKRFGFGRTVLLAYEVRVEGVVVDFLLRSIAPVDLTTAH